MDSVDFFNRPEHILPDLIDLAHMGLELVGLANVERASLGDALNGERIRIALDGIAVPHYLAFVGQSHFDAQVGDLVVNFEVFIRSEFA